MHRPESTSILLRCGERTNSLQQKHEDIERKDRDAHGVEHCLHRRQPCGVVMDAGKGYKNSACAHPDGELS